MLVDLLVATFFFSFMPKGKCMATVPVWINDFHINDQPQTSPFFLGHFEGFPPSPLRCLARIPVATEKPFSFLLDAESPTISPPKKNSCICHWYPGRKSIPNGKYLLQGLPFLVHLSDFFHQPSSTHKV